MLNSGCCREGHTSGTFQILKVVGALPQAETVHLCLEHCLVHTTTGAGADAQWQRCMYEYIYKYMKYMNYHLYEKPPELALMLNGSAVCKAAIQSSHQVFLVLIYRYIYVWQRCMQGSHPVKSSGLPCTDDVFNLHALAPEPRAATYCKQGQRHNMTSAYTIYRYI